MTWAEAVYKSVLALCAFGFLSLVFDRAFSIWGTHLITYTRSRIKDIEHETATGELPKSIEPDYQARSVCGYWLDRYRSSPHRDVGSTSARKVRRM